MTVCKRVVFFKEETVAVFFFFFLLYVLILILRFRLDYKFKLTPINLIFIFFF